MNKPKDWPAEKKAGLTIKHLLIAVAVAVGVFSTFNAARIVYNATRGTDDEKAEDVPVHLELERAQAMINDLVPDIQKLIVVIATEEVAVVRLRQEVETIAAQLYEQRAQILRIRNEAESGEQVRIDNLPATDEQVNDVLRRRLTRYKLVEAKLRANEDLLAAREHSLLAAQLELDKVITVKRELETQVASLQVRLQAIESNAVLNTVELNESQVAECRDLIDEIHVRLQVAERVITANGDIDVNNIQFGRNDVRAEIDSHFGNDVSGNEAPAQTH